MPQNSHVLIITVDRNGRPTPLRVNADGSTTVNPPRSESAGTAGGKN